MEIQQIRYFVAVANEQNFTRAAEQCRVAQPSLSQQIQKLENELGGPLFHRLGRKVRLTDLGEALLPRVERILQLHKETLREANERSARGGNVRFGAILTIAPYLTHLVVKMATDRRADFKIEAYEDFTENLLKKLHNGDLDFAIMSTPVDEPGMLCRTLASEPFVAVFPEEHPLLEQAKVPIEPLLKEPFLPLSYIHCAGKQVNELCGIGVAENLAKMHCTQIETILRLVEQGAGVTILPQIALSRLEGKKLAYRYLENDEARREIALVHHQDRYLGPSARTLIEIVEGCIHSLCPR